MEREPKLPREEWRGEICGTSPAVSLSVSNLLDESEAHKRASQYRSGEGDLRGWLGVSLLRKEEAVKLRGGLSPTPWGPANSCLAKISPDFPLESTGFFPGQHLIHFWC